MNKNIYQKIKNLFEVNLNKGEDLIVLSSNSSFKNQKQTNNVFSDKWMKYEKENYKEKQKLLDFQKKWYLKLYNFKNDDELKSYLSKKEFILDAGCGSGNKSKWFADLSPNSIVIGMDYSDSVFEAAKNYKDTPNLVFIKNDIAKTKIKKNVIDYISCDQVIHHTENPQKTLDEFAKILKPNCELAVYVYAKKAIPRELVDEYFRDATKEISKEEMWKLSKQLTELGKKLSELKININFPDVPLLGIKGGVMDIQRFFYWNFLKCFWNENLGEKTSRIINYDWYSPTNAFRYNKNEFKKFLKKSGFKVKKYHHEESCFSGRFFKE